MDLLMHAHERLLAHYQVERWHWQETSTPFEICVGAVLVQHTSWTNVEKALANLRAAGVDSMDAIARLSEDDLATLVRPSGTQSVRARRLGVFADLVLSYGGFDGLFGIETPSLRQLLLATHGIGPETADVMLLYAARRPVIVHDAYTARLCRRLGLGPEREGYDVWREWLHQRLPDDLDFRRRSHAAIVIHCKETCRVSPRCEVCPLREVCSYAAAAMKHNEVRNVRGERA